MNVNDFYWRSLTQITISYWWYDGERTTSWRFSKICSFSCYYQQVNHLCIHSFSHLSIHSLSIYLSTYLYIYLSIHLSTACLSIHSCPSMHLSIHLFIHSFSHLSIHSLSIYSLAAIYLSIYASIYNIHDFFMRSEEISFYQGNNRERLTIEQTFKRLVSTYMYMYMYVHVCTCTCMYMYVHVCTCMYMYVHQYNTTWVYYKNEMSERVWILKLIRYIEEMVSRFVVDITYCWWH